MGPIGMYRVPFKGSAGTYIYIFICIYIYTYHISSLNGCGDT